MTARQTAANMLLTFMILTCIWHSLSEYDHPGSIERSGSSFHISYEPDLSAASIIVSYNQDSDAATLGPSVDTVDPLLILASRTPQRCLAYLGLPQLCRITITEACTCSSAVDLIMIRRSSLTS